MEYGKFLSCGPSGRQLGRPQRWGFLNGHNPHQPEQLKSDARVNRIPCLSYWSPARAQQGGKRKLGSYRKMLILWLLQQSPARTSQRNRVAIWILDIKVLLVDGQDCLSDLPELQLRRTCTAPTIASQGWYERGQQE